MSPDALCIYMYVCLSNLGTVPLLSYCSLCDPFIGVYVRQLTKEEREQELVFIGMKAPMHRNDALEKEMRFAYLKRKQEQAANKEAFQKDLIDLKVSR